MDVRTALNALLSDPTFQALEDRLRDRSIFHVLGLETREVYHSRLLAWLLDARESHGFGTRPLRTFMLMATRPDRGPIDAVAVDELDLDAAVVTAEFEIEDGRRLDVLVQIDERPILVIELKVNAAEGHEQTSSYASWAADQAQMLECPPPVLVFLCPDRRDESQPAAPFVHLAYEPYCAWLERLVALAKDTRSRVLVSEYLACISQRDDVEAPDVLRMSETLEREHRQALATLRGAKREARRTVEPTLRRHDRALTKLGVAMGRRGSFGPSAFVAKVRAAVADLLSPERWETSGGEATLNVVFKPADAVVKRLLGPDARLNIKFWATRPTRGNARLILGSWVGARGPEHRSLSARVSESMRAHVGALAVQHPGRSPAVMSIKVELPDIRTTEDDTAEAVEASSERIAAAVRLIRDLEPALEAWAKTTLPSLLKTGVN